ncbi:hypothetical protein ACH5RR_001102 [Cinchona calisaya]|uniref:Uncharacterized protein n=1 Tax=Cinchona calisaya TaxID=153742 RepID=A0ABD3B2P9_9GENT
MPNSVIIDAIEELLDDPITTSNGFAVLEVDTTKNSMDVETDVVTGNVVREENEAVKVDMEISAKCGAEISASSGIIIPVRSTRTKKKPSTYVGRGNPNFPIFK